MKVNSDGAVRHDVGRAATGIVARHCHGFLATSARDYAGIADPLVIEALAMRDACTLALESGFSNVCLETDCEVLLKL